MRPRIVIASFALAASVGGCTFLIDFQTMDLPPDAGTEAGGVDAADGASPLDGGPAAFPPPCDPTFPLAQVKCNASYPRPECASNTTIFASYPAGHDRTNDLVTCNGGATPTCVQHCPFGCASMPPTYPDMCDDCNGRADGTYCVKDLRGADSRDDGLAVDCKGGKTVQAHVCGVDRCATKCPRTDPLPSCCI